MLKIIMTASVLALLGAMLFVSEAQETQSRLASANGQGMLRVGDEKFQINSVVVKLIDDRKAEITLVSDITIFLTATWSNHADSPQEFDLEVKGGANPGSLEGTGKVLLSSDGKSVARLSLKGVSRTSKRSMEANFEGK